MGRRFTIGGNPANNRRRHSNVADMDDPLAQALAFSIPASARRAAAASSVHTAFVSARGPDGTPGFARRRTVVAPV